ncbi:MAG TPA: hypothetical protein VEL79_18790 [Vicinamibacterales bacterium]|nr:hypothetical protein [Vicinamibacterales bacterium]
MRRSILAAVLLFAFVVHPGAATPLVDRLWFCPGPGTVDYLDLFQHPEEWPRARAVMDVFKFYQQHTQTPAPSIVGPNTFDALARAGAFQLLPKWGKKIAIEAGSVKEFYCTPDASGMNASIASTLASISAVEGAGGTVSYLAMDEPFVAGRSRVCGGPALEPTADRVATYVAAVTAARPKIRIGLIEAYPFSSADAIQTLVQLLKTRNATPAFLHMDVDWHLSGSAAFKRDMAILKAFCAAQNIPFGVIIVGYNADADALYAVDVYGITELIATTFDTWDQMPDHLIVQSFVETSTGLFITPSNLPEDKSYTHTEMLWDVFRRLRGSAGPSTGRAIIRKEVPQ